MLPVDKSPQHPTCKAIPCSRPQHLLDVVDESDIVYFASPLVRRFGRLWGALHHAVVESKSAFVPLTILLCEGGVPGVKE